LIGHLGATSDLSPHLSRIAGARRRAFSTIAVSSRVCTLPPSTRIWRGFAFDPDTAFAKWSEEISAEATLAHFGVRLGEQSIQYWNLSARYSLFPFGVLHIHHLGGVLDGAPEIGLGPTFARLENVNRNYAGVGLAIRYYLVHFSLGPGCLRRRLP
jgi:hypothetical protein